MDAVTVEFAETDLYKYGRPFCMRVKKKSSYCFTLTYVYVLDRTLESVSRRELF